jgi:hypothetical protein
MIILIIGWLIHLGEFLVAINLLMLLIAAIVMRLRGAAGGLLFMSAWVWAITLTVWCAVTVYSGWGWFLAIVGLALGGVGIVPVAFFCLLLTRSWGPLGELLFQCALVACGYALAPRLMQED